MTNEDWEIYLMEGSYGISENSLNDERVWKLLNYLRERAEREYAKS